LVVLWAPRIFPTRQLPQIGIHNETQVAQNTLRYQESEKLDMLLVMGHQAAEVRRLEGVEKMRCKASNRMHLAAAAVAPTPSRAAAQNDCGLPESTSGTASDTTSVVDGNPLANLQQGLKRGGTIRLKG